MKKIFASIAALMLSAIATTASAQAVMVDDSFPWRFGIQLGFNVPTFSESRYSSTIGWNFGATALYDTQDFIPDSYLRGSVTYTRKGTASGLDKITTHDVTYEFSDLTSYLHYFEIPIHFGYAYEVNDMICLMAETGPYFSMRLSGSLRTDDTRAIDKNGNHLPDKEGPYSESMKDYYRELRRFDVGWGVRAGVLIDKKYEFTVGYDWGLCDVITKTKINPTAGCNLNLSINATVYFD